MKPFIQLTYEGLQGPTVGMAGPMGPQGIPGVVGVIGALVGMGAA